LGKIKKVQKSFALIKKKKLCFAQKKKKEQKTKKTKIRKLLFKKQVFLLTNEK
jgi:hypothetical protein